MSRVRDKRKVLNKLERLSYKTDRRIQQLKTNAIKVKQAIEAVKKEIIHDEGRS